MKNVLYAVNGIGFGHASRSRKIITELKSVFGVSVSTYGSASKIFEECGIDFIKLNGFSTHGSYGIDVWKTISNEKTAFFKIAGDYLKLKKLNDLKGFSSIISDGDPIGIIAANFLQKKSIVVESFFQLLDEVKYLPLRLKRELGFQIKLVEKASNYLDKYVNNFIRIRFEPSKDFRNSLFVGLLNEQRICPDEFNRFKVADFISIPLPGTDINLGIVKQLIALAKKYPNQRFHFINLPISVQKKLKNIHIFPFMSPEKVKAHIKASKAVISFAGINTISDVLLFNKPSLILPLPNHVEQLCNATYLRRNKLAQVLYPNPKFSDLNLVRSFEKMLGDSKIFVENIKSKSFNLNGTSEIIKSLKKIV